MFYQNHVQQLFIISDSSFNRYSVRYKFLYHRMMLGLVNTFKYENIQFNINYAFHCLKLRSHKTKTHIYHAIVKSTMTCSRNMVFKSKNHSKTKFRRNGLLATLGSNFQEGKFRNNIIKQKMNVTRSLLDDIKTKQLQWYGHVQRMEEGRLPKEVMK